MAETNKINSFANIKQQSNADLRLPPRQIVTDSYEATSTLNQSIINLSFAVDMSNKASFQLHINGALLREGSSNDYTFTNIQANNTSSQVTLTQALPLAGFNIIAKKLGVDKEVVNVSNLQAELARRKVYPNYILNSTFEYEDVMGWLLYNDSAAIPVDGTGGTVNANVTFAVTEVNPLRGAKSALLSKDAANRQGHGVGYEFFIDNADKNKSLVLKMDVSGSANYQAGYVKAYVYDMTNNTLCGANSLDVSSDGQYQATFSSSNSNSYRLILHIASADTSAWSLMLDDVHVGQPDSILGYPASDWQDFTMVIDTHLSTPPTRGGLIFEQAQWRRDGQDMIIRWDYAQNSAGSSGSGTYQWLLPPGYKIDLTKVTVFGDGDGFVTQSDKYLDSIIGWGLWNNSNIREFEVAMFPVADDRIGAMWDNTTGFNGDFNHGIGFGTSANWRMTFEARVPIANWDSNVQLTSSKVEYAWNSNTSDSNNLVAFSYGAVGAPIGSYTTAERTKRVRFPNPVSQTDHVFVEVKENGNWIRLADHALNPVKQGSVRYGIRVVPVSGSLTDYDVIFGDGGAEAGSSYGGAGSAWSGYTALSWRLVKSANALGVESAFEESEIWMTGGAGMGSTADSTREYVNIRKNVGSSMLLQTDSVNGTRVTIMTRGVYAISVNEQGTNGDIWGITRNSSDPVGTINALPFAEVIGKTVLPNAYDNMAKTLWLEVGDVIRVQGESGGSLPGTADASVQFRIVRVK